jgi:CheY-like chemotaxis protein
MGLLRLLASTRAAVQPICRVKKHVLVVDDHEDTVELFAEELREAGFDVEGTTNPNDALNIALAKGPDALVLDIAMPDMDGYELARLVRSYASTRNIRLIAVSAHAFDFSKHQVPPGGWDACVRKPVEPGTLAAVIRTVLSVAASPAPSRSGPVMIHTPKPGNRNGTGDP